MDYDQFYKQLFAPLEAPFGPIDPVIISAIVGFDVGGPLSFCTVGLESGRPCITYVSCELALREDQLSNVSGRYELLVSCDDEHWVRSIVTKIGGLSLGEAFNDDDTLDIGAWVDPDAPIQGAVFEQVSSSWIDGQPYGILRLIGVTRPELEYAVEQGTPALLQKLKIAGVYPNTRVNRASVV